MNYEMLADAQAVARRAAAIVADAAWDAVAARGLFLMGVSGGHTPWLMLRALADACVPWRSVHIVQVDERVAPAGHADRNLTHLRASLLPHTPIPPDQIYAMPVESPDLQAAAEDYAAALGQIAGSPPVLDLIHLGLGLDGHTASLVPGDAVLHVGDADVAVTDPYQGRRRMTLTYPIVNRARRILWVVTGSEKAPMVDRLLSFDREIPAGRVRKDRALLLTDLAAAPGRGLPPRLSLPIAAERESNAIGLSPSRPPGELENPTIA
jgi:6-phosphogluconolactonase